MSTHRSKRVDQEHCPVTGKRRFKTQKKALRQANHWWAGDPDDYWRAYRCPHCGSVHLTGERPGEHIQHQQEVTA